MSKKETPLMANSEKTHLKRTLGPLMLWGLGVGYVISGMYFGWNLGLEKGGTLGLGIATIFISIMYFTFTLSYAELACSIPRAGGVFDYCYKAFGKNVGFVAGMSQVIEFVFAPPAIALAIGAYFHLFFPEVPTLLMATVAYFIFTGLNIYGVKSAATFELVVTILAVFELLLFAGITLPAFEWKNLTHNALPHGVEGIFAAIPFAIWFFLAIEGVANVAEETVNPQKNIFIGFSSAIVTLVILCYLTFFSAVGVNGWEAVVYPAAGASASDSPLPLALKQLVGGNHFLYHLLVSIGLLGLVASFHGIILAAGRATYEFGRLKMFPAILGKVHPKFRTPSNALLANLVVGIMALYTGKTGEIITIACFGALTLYIFSMTALITLRKKEPQLERPFKVPFYPLFPLIALIIATFSLVVLAIYNKELALIYGAMLLLSFIWFKLTHKDSDTDKEADPTETEIALDTSK